MGIAELSSKRSKDPSTQVGACIVNGANKIVGIGYNGFPTGISDDDFPWGKTGQHHETKYPYVCHAELNAILNSNVNLQECQIYVTHFPCSECTKAIIQSGIKKITYLHTIDSSKNFSNASKKMIESASVTLNQLKNYKGLKFIMEEK